jgi:hypothetical protein
MLFVLVGCEAAPIILEDIETTPCIEVEDLSFYASTQTTTLGTKDVIMVETQYGDIEIDEEIYDYTVLDIYSHLCFNVTNNEIQSFKSTRQRDLAIPEPPTIYVDVPVIEYVDVEVEVIVEVEVEVEVPVEVVIHTHDLIDPDEWVASNHDIYYYFLAEGVIHLVYTNLTSETLDMYLFTIIYDSNLVFSDQAVVSTLTHYTSVGVEGFIPLSTELVDTEFTTAVEFVENFILTNTYEQVVAQYEAGDPNA